MEIESNQGYEEQAAGLALRYDTKDLDNGYAWFRSLMPLAPARFLDIGSGSGRDALYFSSLGYTVCAVEPTDAFRAIAMAKPGAEKIEWLEDALPELASLEGRCFDIITMMAVFMHFDERERMSVLQTVSQLLAPKGILAMTIRHGEVPEGRRMFEIADEEVIDVGEQFGLKRVHQARAQSLQACNAAKGIIWSQLVFQNG